MQPFRFAVYTNNSDDADQWTAFARRAEELGYAALYVTDHLGRQLAPTAALAAAAAVTHDLRIGPYVFANDFRHPLIVAREAATLDRLSGGRLDLGLGAGWKRSDYRKLGMTYDPPAIRIDRMIESLGIIRRLLAGEEVTHDGRFYRLDRARVEPRPVQQPHPRIMLGGGGPRMLRFAAREAQIVSFVPQFSTAGRPMMRHATETALAERVAQVRSAAGTTVRRARAEHLRRRRRGGRRLAAALGLARCVVQVRGPDRCGRLALPAVRDARSATRRHASAAGAHRRQLVRNSGPRDGGDGAAGGVACRALAPDVTVLDAVGVGGEGTRATRVQLDDRHQQIRILPHRLLVVGVLRCELALDGGGEGIGQ